jgi:glycosyltransferase involved in cell wall biosynthesis
MSQAPCKISVIIPTYNCAAYLGRAIDSVMNQTCPPHEIIVVDDGSQDNTRDIVQRYGLKVTYLYQNNAGANEARNAGVSLSSGDWLAFLDADDEWFAQKLEWQCAILHRHPDLVWVYGNQEIRFCTTGEKSLFCAPEALPAFIQDERIPNYIDAYACGLWMMTSTMLIRKDVYLEAGGFLPGQRIHHDTDLALRIAYRHPCVGFCVQPLVYYTEGRPGSITRNTALDIQERWLFIKKHLALSAEYGYLSQFRRCADALILRWSRNMKKMDLNCDISPFIRECKEALCWKTKMELYFRMYLPRLAARCCDGYLTLKHYFKIQRTKR